MSLRDVAPEKLHPTSAAQRRLWYMANLASGDPYYNVTLAIRISITLQRDALSAALSKLVTRHEILRTCYPVQQGVPWQMIEDAETWYMEYRGELQIPLEQRVKACTALAEEIARLPIDLAHGKVFQAFLWRFSPDDHLLVLFTHHIAIDQRSINRLCLELDALYISHLESRPSGLSTVAQYREYAHFEQSRFEQDRQRLLSYWDIQLIGAGSPLILPYDVPPTASDRDRSGSEYNFVISSELLRVFRTWCRRERMTEFNGLLSVWTVLLHLLSKSERLFIGTTTAFREEERFATMLGCFINTLVVKIELRRDDTIASIVQGVKNQLLDAFEHRALTYERLVERARTINSGFSGDLLNAYLQFQPRSVVPQACTNSIFIPNLNVFNGRAKFPLMLNVSDRGEHFTCTIEYESGAFRPETIASITKDFISVFSTIHAYADTEISYCDFALTTQCAVLPVTTCSETKQALPVVDTSDREFDEMTSRLADIWHDVLLVRPQHRFEDFFALGGHSLLLTQLVWRIQQDLGVRLPLRELRDATLLDAMAKRVQQAQYREAKTVATPAVHSLYIGSTPVQLELGTWTRDRLNDLISRLRTSTPSASERVLAASLSFSGTPLQVSGARPSPAPGRVPVTLGTFDSISLIYTSLALALAKDFESFVSFLKNMLLDAVVQENHKIPTMLPSFIVRAVNLGWLQTVDLSMRSRHEAAASGFFKTRLRSGDILVFESTSMEATIADACFMDKVAIAMNEAGSIFFCQAVGDYEIAPTDAPAVAPKRSGIYYDTAHQCEQVGVGLRGKRLAGSIPFSFGTILAYRVEYGSRLELSDYLAREDKNLVAAFRLIEGHQIER